MTAPILPPDLDSLLLLESPFARMPYEDLRRRLRTHQRIIEREYAGLNTLASGVASSSSSEDAVRRVDAMIERVKGIKTKLTPLSDEFKTSVETLQTRTKHLAQIHEIAATAKPATEPAAAITATDDDPAATSSSSSHDRAYQQWSDVRLQRMITDWLLRRGYVEAAEKFVKSRDIAALTDLSVFKELFAIRASLIPSSSTSTTTPSASTNPGQRSCSLALAWCMDNKAALRRIKSTLEFDLRLQEFIDMCRNRSAESLSAAIAHARRHLLPLFRTAQEALAAKPSGTADAPTAAAADGEEDAGSSADAQETRRSNEKIVETVGRALGLLAIAPGGWAYEDLYSYTRYSKLYETLLSAALHIHSLPPQPLLHIALSAGLSSLKVPACYHGQRGPVGGSSNSSNGNTDGSSATVASAATAAAAGTGEPSAWLNPIDEDLLYNAEGDTLTSPPSSSDEVTKLARARTKRRIADEMRNENCPVCSIARLGGRGDGDHDGDVDDREDAHTEKKRGISLGLGTLAKEVPWSHHSNSTIVCRITGKLIDDSEDGGGGAVVLPNGRVYSRSALEPRGGGGGDADAAAAGSLDSVVCPRTGMTFQRSEIKRVYIS